MKIYNLGSLNIDYVYSVEHFTHAGETLASHDMKVFPGGKGLNQSIALSRAGSKVIHGAVIGSDGEFLKQVMENDGIDVSRIKTIEKPNGHAIIQLDKNGQNSILLYGGANREVDREYIEQFLFDAEKDDILLLQNEISCLPVAFEVAVSHNMQIAFNPSPFDSALLKLPLKHIKWWFCNEIEGEALFGSDDPYKMLQNFISDYPDSNLVLTLGSRGSLFKNRECQIEQRIYKTQVVDTTAAGDTFTGYFLSLVASGKDISYALDIASKAASITVSQNGASSSIPFVDEIK